MSIIWYGAGKNVKDYEAQFVAETGYPEYICDSDVKKQGAEYVFEGGRSER